MKIWWIKRLCENEQRPWQSLATYWLKPISGTSVFHSNLELSQISNLKLQTLPDLYKDLIKFWINISQSDVGDVQNILSQSIWDNKQITIQKQPIFDKYLANKNLNLVADLVENGKFKTWEVAKRDLGLPQVLFLR